MRMLRALRAKAKRPRNRTNKNRKAMNF
jgi:hypothetical protein